MASDTANRVVIGALNPGKNTHSVGTIDGVNCMACAIGSDVHVFTDGFKRIQVISHEGDYGIVTAVNCCSESGRLAICHANRIRVFEPTPHQPNGEEQAFPYRWIEAQNWTVDNAIDSVEWILGGLRLLIFADRDLLLHQHKILSCAVAGGERAREKNGVKFTITPDDECVWEVVWQMKLASRVRHVRVSHDGALFATCGDKDPLVKIWYQLKDSNSFSFIYIQHPSPVCGFEWRKSGGYFMPKRWAHNALITWCEDNTARIWKEIPHQDTQVELHFISAIEKAVAMQQEAEHMDRPKKQQNKMGIQMRRARGRLMHKLTHLINEKRKMSAEGCAIVNTAPSEMLRSSTFADFSIPTYTYSDTLVFSLAATIDAENDCFLVPSLASSSRAKGRRKPFAVHWLNNKEHQFILGTQQVLADSLPFSNLEQGIKDIQVMHSLHSSTSSAGIAATANDLLDVIHPPHHSITAPNLTKSAANLQSHVSNEETPSAKDLLDYKLEVLLRQWNKSSDILFAIHPLDGSLLTWTLEWLDDPWKQCTVSFASRLPEAFPLADAASLSIWLITLHPSSQFGFTELALSQHRKGSDDESETIVESHQNPLGHLHQNRAALAEKNDVCLLTKHDNNSLNLWRLQIDEQCEQGHGFGVRRKEQAMPFLIMSVLHEYRMCEEQKSEGGTLLEVLNKDSLIDVTQLENPLLPQYHPVQLVGLLNAGRIQRVRAILLNILRSICQRQQSTTPWFKTSGGKRRAVSRQRSRIGDNPQEDEELEQRRRSNSISARVSFDAEQIECEDLDAINPLPLYALLAADSATEHTTNKDAHNDKVENKKESNVYDSLFAPQYAEEDLDLDTEVDVDSFSASSRKHSLSRARKISSGSMQIGGSLFASSNPNTPPSTKFTAKHSRLLTETLTHLHLPGLSSVDQMHLLAIADTISHFTANAMVDRLAQANADLQPPTDHRLTMGDSTASGYAALGTGMDTVDECGLRFLMAKKQHEYLLRCLPLKQRRTLKTKGISTAYIIWAFHSDTEMELLNSIPCCQRQQETWEELRSYGVAWWIKNNATLRICMERVAKNAFQKEQNPMDAALFYLAMRKKNVLTQLFRTVNDNRMYEFFREDFATEKWTKAAMKNAFVLMSKQRFHHAAAFFLLAGSLKDAIQVILNRIGDLQLAMVVLRFYESDSERQLELLTELLCKEVLGCEPDQFHSMVAKKERDGVKFPLASRDPFERSMALWIMKGYALSASTLLEEPMTEQGREEEERRGSLIKESSSREIALADIFNFYSFLRRHPLVIRQKLANAGISTTSTEQFLSWTRRIGAKVSTGERLLYFRTASAHLSAGCPLLALDVLSRLPAQISEESENLYGNLANKLESKKEEPEQIDWSTPLSKIGRDEEDKLELKWSDEENDEKEEGGGGGQKENGIAQNIEDGIMNSEVEQNQQKGPVDTAAQDLKSLATLSIMTDELNTLVVGGGYEVAGGQLRLELFSWLERECEILHKICDIQDDDHLATDGYGSPESFFIGDEDEEDGQSSSDSVGYSAAKQPTSTGSGDVPPLHEALRQDRNELRERVRLALRRRHWLRRHRHLLCTLASYCALHSGENSRLVAVQMELLLLLLEVQQNESNELRHPNSDALPGIHTFPLLVSSLPSNNIPSSLTSPLRFMTDQYAHLMHTINEFNRPPQIDSDKTKLHSLFNLCQVLSLCVYQSLSDVENLVKTSFSRFSGPLTQPLWRPFHGIHSGMATDEEAAVISSPSQWPGVTSLVALLSRERLRGGTEASGPNLRLLLVEFFVAVTMSLFCYAFALYDCRWLFRICAHATDGQMFAKMFGGGGERRLRSTTAVPARPPPPMRTQQQQEAPQSIDQPDSTAAIRAKLHAKVFRVETASLKPAPSGRQPHSEQIVQCWVPPKKHIVQYFAEKIVPPDGSAGNQPSDFYDSDEETPEESEADEEMQNELADELGVPKDPDTQVLPHDAPKGYAWTLMRLAVVRHVQHSLKQFIEMAGFDIQEIAHISPKLNLTLKRINSWGAQLEDELEGWADGCPAGFIPTMSIQDDLLQQSSSISSLQTNSWTSPLLHKYRVLLEPRNTPFEYDAPRVRAVRRLWVYLVTQEHLASIFVRYIFGKSQDKIGSSITKTTDVNNILSVVKLVHREHDPIVAFAANSIKPGYIVISTGRELQELSIERVLDERERIMGRLSHFPSTSSFLLSQNRAELDISLQQIRRDPLKDNDDYQLLIPGGEAQSQPGRSVPAQMSSNVLNTFIVDRSRLCLQKLRKRPISGIRRLESHDNLPYYASGSSDGSIFLWEWGVEQPVFVARVAGQYAKVAKLAFAQNGARFAAVDGDGLLCLWQAQPGIPAKKPYFSQKCHNKFASDVKFLGQTSTLLVTAGHSTGEQNVVLWDTLMPQAKSVVHSFVGHPDGAYCVVYQPNTQSVISGGKHGEICIWDVRQRQLRTTLKAFTNANASVRCICLDPSGDTFATGSSEGDIKIWSCATVVPQLLYSLPTEHAARSGFSLRQVASISLQGVQQIDIDSHMHMFSCGADNSLKLRVIPSFSAMVR